MSERLPRVLVTSSRSNPDWWTADYANWFQRWIVGIDHLEVGRTPDEAYHRFIMAWRKRREKGPTSTTYFFDEHGVRTP